MALFSIWLDTQFTENGQSTAKDLYGFCVEDLYVDVDSNGDSCGAGAALWFTGERNAKNQYFRSNSLFSIILQQN